MKKGLTPLRIPSTNSGSEMLVDTNTTEANYRSEASAEDQGSRAPLMPIMQTNNNLAAGADENLPSFKFRSRNRLFVFGQNKAPNQFAECAPRGSNSSTVDIDVDSSNSSSSENRSRFGWHEPKAQHVETDSSHGNLGIIRQSSNGCALEAAGTQEDLTNNSTNHHEGMVSETPTLVPKHVRNIQSASGLSTICSTEGYSAASSAKNFQMVLKQNFTQRHFEIEEDPTFWDDHNVQVIIRVRPLNAIEVAAQGRSRCVKQESAHSITWLGHPESRFTFDLVAGEKIDQEKLFKVAGVPMVENCIRGYNSCMFAYGQTGSGKTHTMLGDIDDSEQKLSPSRGMTPRVFEHLFERIRKEEGVRAEENLKYICKCSFLEIYNEQVADLLEPSSTNLQMREDAKKGVYVENLREVEVQGVHDVIHLLLQGASNRKVAATNMNLASSRSHSVFTCVIESKWVSQSVTHHRYGRLHLVDLAGSERQKSSGAEGERLKEATNINRSLSTLGLVIMNLVNISNGKSLHVPYRDSKLTFLLQDSLGGNSKTIIIANVSPSNCCAMETLSTLKFAQRAKFIRNNATVNEDATGDVLTLKSQIQQLKEENNRLRAQLKASSSQEDGYCSIGSPGMGTSHSKELTSPLYGHKKGPQQRDMEKSLHGALKRGQDLESLNKALTAENDLLKRSISRLEDDAQCKKMFLRFREDRIKRLEDVASDKLSAEEHLLEEKNELLQELQMTRNSLTKNPIVTNFAMNNIRLQEQLRRYQEFYDHGEREELAAQIQLLSMQLFEALEWKLMHGENIQKEQASETDVTLTSGDTSSLEQAEQYRREAESLRNNLSFCLDTKEKLERRVEDLMAEIETLKANFDAGKLSDTNSEVYGTEMQQEISVKEGLSTERDLKDLIEAISAASQREAEIQSANIHLQRDLEDIRNKLEQSVVDNERLNRMYQKVLQEREEIIRREDDLMVSLENAQGRIVSLNEEIERRLQKNNDGSANADEVNSIAFLRNKLEECESKLKETCQENEIILKRFQAACQERDDAVQRLKEFPGISACHEYMAVTNVATEVNDNGVGNEPTDARAEAEVRRLRCEVEEFKAKLKELFEENEKWAEMYEKAMQEKEYVIGRKIMNDNAPVNKASTLNSDSKCDSVLQEKSTQPESLLVEDGSDGGRVACDAEEQASIELCYLLDRMNINSQENVAELHLPVSDLMSDKDFELHKQKIIVEIQKIHAGLGNMVHNNAKLFQMYQKAATQRNELVKLWQTLAKPLEHVKCTKILPDDKLQQVLCALQKVIENPGFASVMNEFQGLEFRAAEALYSSSLEHSESDETLHLLSKVINEIYLALAKAAKEHKNLAVLYEQSVETKDQIRTAFYKTCQELENCTRDVSLLSRGIDDCRSNTKALVWDFEDVHNTNASAFVYDPKTSNELKLGALKDLQQKVQGIFQTIDAKFENFQISLDKFEDLKKVFEIHLNSIQSEVECLETKLQEDEEIRQELGLLCKTDGCKQGINPMSQHPSEDLVEMRMAKSKLILAGDILREIVNLVDWLGLLEKNYKTLTSLRRKINVRRNEIHTLEADNEQLQIKKSLAYNKFNAIKNLLSGLFSSEEYWNAREENRCLKIQSISTLLKEKMDKVSVLEAQRNTAEASLEKELEILAAKEAEMAFLREKLSLADQQRIDAEKAVTQLEKQTGPSSDLRSSAEQISLNLGTAASLLRGEEERNNLINSLKISYEQLQICKRKTEKLKAELKMSDSLIEQLQSEIDLVSVGLKEAEHSSQKSSSEKESLTDFQTEVMTGVENSVLELQTVEFEVLCKEEELRSSQEELQELTAELAEAENSCQWNETLHAKQDIKSGLLCQLILGKIENVKTFLAEADASLDFQENVQ